MAARPISAPPPRPGRQSLPGGPFQKQLVGRPQTHIFEIGPGNVAMAVGTQHPHAETAAECQISDTLAHGRFLRGHHRLHRDQPVRAVNTATQTLPAASCAHLSVSSSDVLASTMSESPFVSW